MNFSEGHHPLFNLTGLPSIHPSLSTHLSIHHMPINYIGNPRDNGEIILRGERPREKLKGFGGN